MRLLGGANADCRMKGPRGRGMLPEHPEPKLLGMTSSHLMKKKEKGSPDSVASLFGFGGDGGGNGNQGRAYES